MRCLERWQAVHNTARGRAGRQAPRRSSRRAGQHRVQGGRCKGQGAAVQVRQQRCHEEEGDQVVARAPHHVLAVHLRKALQRC